MNKPRRIIPMNMVAFLARKMDELDEAYQALRTKVNNISGGLIYGLDEKNRPMFSHTRAFMHHLDPGVPPEKHYFNYYRLEHETFELDKTAKAAKKIAQAAAPEIDLMLRCFRRITFIHDPLSQPESAQMNPSQTNRRVGSGKAGAIKRKAK